MRGYIAVLTAVVAAALVPSALAGNDHRTLGPAGYDTPGQSALILAGTSGVELGSGDHVVICHAIGGANGDRFIQIAPSASGVVNGHNGHEGDRDVIPPYTYVDHGGDKDSSLATGNNWAGANLSLYNAGCEERGPENPPEQPKDECPNIPGNQQSVPAGLVKDSSGNCVTQREEPPTDVCPNIEGLQSAVPAGFVKDASGNCICPPVTVTVNSIPQTVPQTVVVQSAPPAAVPAVASVIEKKTAQAPKAKKKVKKKAKRVKAKKAKKKAKRVKAKRGRLPRVLPFTPFAR